MNNGKRRVARLLAIVWMLQFMIAIFTPDTAKAQTPGPILDSSVQAAILLEASTGQVLYEYNADTPRYPASMAKMMTEYLVLEQIKLGRLSLTDVVTISEYASRVGGSGIGLALGERHSVNDLLKLVAVASGNNASVALAEAVAGSEASFVRMMNEKARELGLSEHAYFINATGLDRASMGANAPAEFPGETMLTARDTALLAHHLVNNHPEVLEYSKIPSYVYRERDGTIYNWNWMLGHVSGFLYEGLDGLKTGSTREAGYNFTGTAVRNNMRLVSVIMGTDTERRRFDETRKLLDFGFNTFEKKVVLSAKTELPDLPVVPIRKGVKKEVSLVTQQGAEFYAPRGEDAERFSITVAPIDESLLVAPIKQGDVLGYAKVTYFNGYTELVKQVELIAVEDVDKGSWFRLLFRGIGNFFSDIFSGITNGIKSIF